MFDANITEDSMSKVKQQSHPSASTQRSHPHDLPQPGKQGAQYENTYKLEPDITFPSAPIRKIINEILQVIIASFFGVLLVYRWLLLASATALSDHKYRLRTL